MPTATTEKPATDASLTQESAPKVKFVHTHDDLARTFESLPIPARHVKRAQRHVEKAKAHHAAGDHHSEAVELGNAIQASCGWDTDIEPDFEASTYTYPYGNFDGGDDSGDDGEID